MNKVVLVGRLTNNPELRTTATGTQIANFSIAVNRAFKNANGEYDADFPNCIAFGNTADFINRYFGKGDPIGISGRIQTGKYQNKKGDTVYTTDVVVENAEFVIGKRDSEKNGEQNNSGTKSRSKSAEAANNSNSQNADDDEYPF